MLEQHTNELDKAIANAITIMDSMNEDGQTFEYRKQVITFKGAQIEFLFKRRPGSGLVADGQEDPAKGPKYTMTIFIPATGKVIDVTTKQEIMPQIGSWVKNVFVDSLTPTTEFIMKLIESISVNNHEELVAERAKDQADASANRKLDEWKKSLTETTDFKESEVGLFIDYIKDVAGEWKTGRRAEIFVEMLKKHHKRIIATDLAACDIQENVKLSYTLLDVTYNIICQLLEKQLKNNHWDYFIPAFAIQNRILNTDAELSPKMPTFVRSVRSFLRELWADCLEKSATFAFVLNGIARYYEVKTGESVEMRIARERSRRKDVKKAEPKNDKPKKQVEEHSFGNLGDVFGEAFDKMSKK